MNNMRETIPYLLSHKLNAQKILTYSINEDSIDATFMSHEGPVTDDSIEKGIVKFDTLFKSVSKTDLQYAYLELEKGNYPFSF